MSDIKKVNEMVAIKQKKQDDIIQDAVVAIENAQLSINEKKARFKRMRDNGARLTRHRFTV